MFFIPTMILTLFFLSPTLHANPNLYIENNSLSDGVLSVKCLAKESKKTNTLELKYHQRITLNKHHLKLLLNPKAYQCVFFLDRHELFIMSSCGCLGKLQQTVLLAQDTKSLVIKHIEKGIYVDYAELECFKTAVHLADIDLPNLSAQSLEQSSVINEAIAELGSLWAKIASGAISSANKIKSMASPLSPQEKAMLSLP